MDKFKLTYYVSDDMVTFKQKQFVSDYFLLFVDKFQFLYLWHKLFALSERYIENFNHIISALHIIKKVTSETNFKIKQWKTKTNPL